MLQLRGISGCRLMVALVFTPPSPSISTLIGHQPQARPGTDPGTAAIRPWVLSLLYARSYAIHAPKETRPPSDQVRLGPSASGRGSWPVIIWRQGAGTHGWQSTRRGGRGGRYVSQVIFDISLVCAKGVRGRSMLGIWIIRLPGWSQVVQMVHIAVVWPCCPCPSTAQCPATSST